MFLSLHHQQKTGMNERDSKLKKSIDILSGSGLVYQFFLSLFSDSKKQKNHSP